MSNDRIYNECPKCDSAFVVTIIDSSVDDIEFCPFCGEEILPVENDLAV